MRDPDEEPTQEDAFHASMLSYVSAIVHGIWHGNWLLPALILPAILVPQVVTGTPGALLVASTWLVIGAAYWAIEYRRHAVHTLWALILVVIALGFIGGLVIWTISTTPS